MKLTNQIDTCAVKLAVLADPTRLRIIEVLVNGPCNVKTINSRVTKPQNLLSHHLKVLRDAGLVKSSRDGRAVRYELTDEVEVGLDRKAINLGCCSLTFPVRLTTIKKAAG